MKLICTQENLKSGLAMVGRIISSSNTLPILSNLLLKTENGMLKISSTNLEIAIITQVRCKVEEDGETTVVAKTLTELVNNMPNKNISLVAESGNLKIETDNYHTTIKTLPSEEFPLIPKLEQGTSLIFNAVELRDALSQVVFAASTNQTQPEISGVMLVAENGQLKIVATDRYRLAEKTLKLKDKSINLAPVIIPQKTIVELIRIIGGQEGEVEMIINNNQAGLGFKDTQIISRLVDGQYPDYQQIIPSNFSTTAITQKQPLVSALRAAAIFSQNSNSVKFDLSAKKQAVVLEAESSELGKSVVELPSSIQGEGGQIIFNYHYVLDCLANLPVDNLTIKVINDNSPALIVPGGEDSYLYLVMPIKS